MLKNLPETLCQIMRHPIFYYSWAYISLFCFTTLAGCASNPEGPQNVIATIPDNQWWQTQAPKSSIALQNLAKVRLKMMAISQSNFQIGLSDAGQINASASDHNGVALVIFNQGFLNEFGTDSDVLAITLGHEIAHYQLGHTAPEYANNRNAIIGIGSQALGMIAGYFVPFSGLLVGNGVKAIGLGYSRDDERDADARGMQIAMSAGYSACGSYRLASRLNEMGQSATIPFLSTHPGNNERKENAERFNYQSNGVRCTDPEM